VHPASRPIAYMQHTNEDASEKAGVSIGAFMDSHVISGLRIDGDVVEKRDGTRRAAFSAGARG
jgi:hypothetical protein